MSQIPISSFIAIAIKLNLDCSTSSLDLVVMLMIWIFWSAWNFFPDFGFWGIQYSFLHHFQIWIIIFCLNFLLDYLTYINFTFEKLVSYDTIYLLTWSNLIHLQYFKSMYLTNFDFVINSSICDKMGSSRISHICCNSFIE